MTPWTIECRLPADARKPTTTPRLPACEPGRVPRVARWLALAIRLETRLADGTLADAATVARESHVTRARVSQVLNLAFLAPDLQEAVLNLPRVAAGRDPVTLGDLQRIALTLDWREQRLLWAEVRKSKGF